MGSSWIQINLIEDGPEFIIGAGGKHPVEDAGGGGNRCRYSILLLAQLERSRP